MPPTPAPVKLSDAFQKSAFVRDSLAHITAGRPARLENLQALSLPLMLWAAARALPGPLIAVVPGVEQAWKLEEELQFIAADSGLPARIAALPDYEIEEAANDDAVRAARRARLIAIEALYSPADTSTIVTATLDALCRRAPSPEAWRFNIRSIRIGDELEPARLAALLAGAGYEPAQVVEREGQFSLRGGLVDVFPPTAPEPLRVEFLGSRVEEIRAFNPDTQRSKSLVAAAALPPAWEVAAPPSQPPPHMRPDHREALLHGVRIDGAVLYPAAFGLDACLAHAPGAVVALVDPDNSAELFAERKDRALKRLVRDGFSAPETLLNGIYLPETAATENARLTILTQPSSSPGAAPVLRLPSLPLDLSRMTEILKSETERSTVIVVSRFHTRLERYLTENGVFPAAIIEGDLSGGFRLNDARLAVFTDAEVFPRRKTPKVVRARADDREPVLLPSDISAGDFVVHIDHGIGRYEGITTQALPDGRKGDFFSLSYAGKDRLFVPIEQLERIEKYIGATNAPPRVHTLHSGRWGRVKLRAREKIAEIAASLFRLYDERENIDGFPFPAETMYMAELEASFPFDETPDQTRSIDETMRDMERRRPMDRLVFGDVGFGKTEIAVRAAMKAAMAGKQTAIVAPTTILAHQHELVFKNRFARFPVSVEAVSRLKSLKERKATLKRLASGEIDIIIGTHRLLQNDVAFKDLGLLVVDEEQRFGVKHKERLKMLKSSVDALTLTATPIPRTLNMSLIGLRDVSLIETPPEDRKAVQTFVQEWNFDTLRHAIERELARNGQIFFLHNDIGSIPRVKQTLDSAFPSARIDVCHGKMSARLLEDTMIRFLNRDCDILLCTTIIENGIDIPNANTLVVNGAENFGLSQLYQLRGRIGRSHRQSWAYFFHSPPEELSDKARRRLEAIREFAELGAGYRLALRDLEIRGAGNLLGREQHGYITEVGFNLYTQMLSESVKRLKGKPIVTVPRADVELGLSAHIPDTWVADTAQRTAAYKNLLSSRTQAALDSAAAELRDRFGDPPEPAENFLLAQSIRIHATETGIRRVVSSAHAGVTDLFPDNPALLEAFRPFASPGRRKVEVALLHDRVRLLHAELPLATLTGEIVKILNAVKKSAGL